MKNQWGILSEEYQSVLSQKEILWPRLATLQFKGKSVLDVGCGDGRYVKHFASQGAEIQGVDCSSEMIALAKDLGMTKNTFFCEDFTRFKTSRTYNVLFLNMVICNIESILVLGHFAEKIFKLTNRGSRIYITNVHESYQRSCNTHTMMQEYPSNVYEGVKFDAQLKKEDGSWMGPFTNYHWSRDLLAKFFAQYNLYPLRSERIFSQGVDRKTSPIYELLTFERK